MINKICYYILLLPFIIISVIVYLLLYAGEILTEILYKLEHNNESKKTKRPNGTS